MYVQEQALFLMRTGDLRGFTDLLNTAEVEAGGAAHWLNQPAEGGASLLELAAREGRFQAAEVLVEVGARTDQVGEATGLTPLHVAVEQGDLAMLKLLLRNRYRTVPVNQSIMQLGMLRGGGDRVVPVRLRDLRKGKQKSRLSGNGT